jgi:hypothetical protein
MKPYNKWIENIADIKDDNPLFTLTSFFEAGPPIETQKVKNKRTKTIISKNFKKNKKDFKVNNPMKQVFLDLQFLTCKGKTIAIK